MSSLQSPKHLRCDYLINPVGLDEARPRLSWEVSDDRQGAKQTAYQIGVGSSAEKLSAGEFDVWNTGKVSGDQSIQIEYAGKALTSRQRCFWQVRTWDAEGNASPWSEVARWEMGLLARGEWTGQWIGSHLAGTKEQPMPVPYLRKGFAVKQKVQSARLYVTALGLYECEINGERVGEDCFRPGWTDYNKRVQYQVYDVTALVKQGENALGAMLGDGWYCGRVGWAARQRYGDRPKLLAQLEITLADGSKQTIATDETWKYNVGPITESDMQWGESYDARREMPGWSNGGFDDGQWLAVVSFADSGAKLVARVGPAVKAFEELHPVAEPVLKTGWEKADWIYDLGQNFAGRVRLKMKGKAGMTATLRHAEMLQANGDLYIENLRGAKATDTYTFKDAAEVIWEPRLTFHGFRYVSLSFDPKCDIKPTRDTITGIALYSDMPETGSFECSDAMTNQLQSNIKWGQKSNFLDIPTDCPQRNERLGWTGDAQVFIPTASFNMDVAAFFNKWQQDLADGQSEAGAFGHVAPNPGLTGDDGGPAWADAGIICPWTIYQSFGDTRLLAEHYDSMKKFVDYMEKTGRGCIRCDQRDKYHCYGDWLAIDAPNPGAAPTPKELIGTAYFAHCAELLGKIAKVLGKADEVTRLEALHGKIKTAFNREFVTPAGRVLGNSQTGYLLALGFDLLDAEKQKAVLELLVSDIERRGWHLSTGFVGTPFLAPVLTRFGRLDVAYKLLMQETYPGWFYSIKQGATTMWERWNSYTHEKGFGDAGMNSFNHYAYGAIGQWMYDTIAGIGLDETAPAYKRIVLRPQPGGGLTWAKGSLMSMHGLIESAWKIDGGKFGYAVKIPANTTATVHLPDGQTKEITAGKHEFSCAV